MPLVLRAFAESWGIAGITVLNQRLLHETGSRSVTSIVRERQLRLYGHVARLTDVDPAHMVLSVRDNPEGTATQLVAGKIERSCRDRLGMNRAAAWEFTRGGLPWVAEAGE